MSTDSQAKIDDKQDSDHSSHELIEVVALDDVRCVDSHENIKKGKSKQAPKDDIQKWNSKKTQKNTVLHKTDSSDDEDTPEAVFACLQKGCGCSAECFKNLDPDEVYKHRLNIAELTKSEHDMYLMGVTMASMANSKTTLRQKERQRNRATYAYQGKRVCLEAFLFLENVSLYHIKRIRHHFLSHGVTPRIHGNLGKRAHNAFSLEVYRNVENYLRIFLKPYVTDFNKNQIVHGVKRVDIYNSYKDHGRHPDEKLMGYSTFKHFMKKQFPQIKFQQNEHSAKHTAAECSTPKSNKANKLSKEPIRSIPIKIIQGHVSFGFGSSPSLTVNNESNSNINNQTTAYIVAPISTDSELIKMVSDSLPIKTD